jgi:large subunit ribosomal protein L25
MPEITLVAEPGRESGTRTSRRLRSSGRIPAVIYGHGIAPIAVSVDARELRTALGGEAGTRALLELHVGKDRHLAMARQLQRHPVRHTVTHVDFQVVRRDEVVSAEIPVVIVGDAVAVHRGDGLVDQELTTIPIKAKPADLPTSFEVDISELEIGGAIRFADVKLPPGVESDLDPEHVIVAGRPPRTQELPEEAEAAEGEAAEGDAGAEGAASGSSGGGDEGGESSSGGSGGS